MATLGVGDITVHDLVAVSLTTACHQDRLVTRRFLLEMRRITCVRLTLVSRIVVTSENSTSSHLARR